MLVEEGSDTSYGSLRKRRMGERLLTTGAREEQVAKVAWANGR